uniref:EGF-like domain-containing protein n=1 Tax=Zea mays TaxID=4577 RepID=B6SJM5_MAIZE|nr:hypothetical protein [Zea mays]
MLRRARVPCAAAPAPAPAVVVAVALLALSAVAAADFFSPLAPIFSPVINSICSTVACGQGNCTVAPGTLGYRCDCRPGWTQLHVGDSLRVIEWDGLQVQHTRAASDSLNIQSSLSRSALPGWASLQVTNSQPRPRLS